MASGPVDSAEAAAALYRRQVLEHGRQPRGAGRLGGLARRAQASNALCGDRVAISLRLDEARRIGEIRHDSEGCLLCLASASLMAGRIAGLDAAGVAREREALLSLLRDCDADGDMGELAALSGASPYPSRHRCVLLPWEALLDALQAPETETSP